MRSSIIANNSKIGKPKIPVISNLETCYGLHRMIGSYTGNLVKVRRSGDNAEEDFSWRNDGYLDIASLVSWVVAGGGTVDGFITTWYDQSGNGNNANNTIASYQPVIVKQGVFQDFVDFSTRISKLNAINATRDWSQPFCVSLWIYLTGSNPSEILSNTSGLTNDDGLLIALQSDTLIVASGGKGGRRIFYELASFTSTYPLNQWHHIVVQSDGTNSQVYINNNLVSNGAFRFDAYPGIYLAINAYGSYTIDTTNEMNFDNLQIFSNTLSTTEIEQLYNYFK